MVVPGRRHLSRRNDERAVDEAKIDLRGEPPLPGNRIGAHVRAREDGGRSHLAGGTHRFRDDVTNTNIERRAERPERRLEVCKRFEEKGVAVRRPAVARLPDPLVEHEEREDRLRLLDGPRERGVVVNAEVAREQDDGDAHGPAPTRGSLRRRPASR